MFDVEPETPVATIAQGVDPGARVHPERGSNFSGELVPVIQPELEQLFASAAHVVSEHFTQHRYVCVPMEPRGLVAAWDPWAATLEVVASTQSAHESRAVWSRLLGVPEDAVRVVMGDVGGSFGQKMFPGREDHAVVIADEAARPTVEMDRGPAART